MKMSTRGRYGLRVMLELALRYGRGPVLAEAIAVSQGISGKYIHLLVPSLRAAGLVRASRGPNGGYELARAPSRITVLEAVEALEGKNAPAPCVNDASFCPKSSRCAARDVWRAVAAATDGVLSGITLEALAGKQSAAPEGPATYHI